MKFYANMHTHSTQSDGGFSPVRLAQAAKEEGYGASVLTDHDTVTGYPELKAECEKLAAFVAQGGRLYISGTSSALSTDGTNKDSFMLSDVMGVQYDAFVDTQPIYLAPTKDGASRFPGFTAEYPEMLPKNRLPLPCEKLQDKKVSFS